MGYTCFIAATLADIFKREISGASSSLESERYINMTWNKQPEKSGLALLTAQDLNINIEPENANKSRISDFFWAIVYLIQSNELQIPTWRGFMEVVINF